MASLPPHICQLVDKNNFVIAIKTLAEEQNLTLAEAKAQIDAYEANKKTKFLSNKTQDDLQQLVKGVDNHLKQHNIKPVFMPYWVKRLAIILLVVVLLSWLLFQVFNPMIL